MPSRYKAAMRYSEQISLSTGTIQGFYGTEYSFRLNSLFDPDFTSGGHQPYGFDQIAAWYNRYIVTRVRIELTVTDPSADGLFFGAQIRTTAAAASISNESIGEHDERQGCMTKPINNTGSQVTVMRFDLPLHEVHGLTQTEWLGDISSHGATVSNNPAIVSFLSFAIANASSTTNASVKVLCRLTYDCEFSERLPQQQS